METETNLDMTSHAHGAASQMNLLLLEKGYGWNTTEGFTQLFEDFCDIYKQFPENSIQDSMKYWELHQQYGELNLG